MKQKFTINDVDKKPKTFLSTDGKKSKIKLKYEVDEDADIILESYGRYKISIRYYLSETDIGQYDGIDDLSLFPTNQTKQYKLNTYYRISGYKIVCQILDSINNNCCIPHDDDGYPFDIDILELYELEADPISSKKRYANDLLQLSLNEATINNNDAEAVSELIKESLDKMILDALIKILSKSAYFGIKIDYDMILDNIKIEQKMNNFIFGDDD